MKRVAVLVKHRIHDSPEVKFCKVFIEKIHATKLYVEDFPVAVFLISLDCWFYIVSRYPAVFVCFRVELKDAPFAVFVNAFFFVDDTPQVDPFRFVDLSIFSEGLGDHSVLNAVAYFVFDSHMTHPQIVDTFYIVSTLYHMVTTLSTANHRKTFNIRHFRV